MLFTKPSRAATLSGLISLVVGAAFLCAYYPGSNVSRGAIDLSAAESGLRRNARSAVSEIAADPLFKGTWLDPEGVDSTQNLGAWSKTLVEPTTTELKPESAVDSDFEQWKRERRDVSVVRRIEDARRQAPAPNPSDVFTPIPPPPVVNPPVVTPANDAQIVLGGVSAVRTAVLDHLESVCSAITDERLAYAQCLYNAVVDVVDTLVDSELLALIATRNPAVAAAIREVQDDLKAVDDECSNEDTSDAYMSCIRKKLDALDKDTKGEAQKSALVKVIKRYYADINVCSGKAEAQTNICNKKPEDEVEKCTENVDKAAKKCNQKGTDKLLSKLGAYANAALGNAN